MKLQVQEWRAVPLRDPVERSEREHRPVAVWPLLFLLGTLSIGGFVGGISFLRDRTGASLGAKISWLEKTPVHDFLLPGLFLLGVYGVGCILLMIGWIRPLSPGPLRRLDVRLRHHWSWVGTIGVGLILVGWILYEFWIFPDRMILQPILIAYGVAMVGACLLPSMRRYDAARIRRPGRDAGRGSR